MYTRGYDNTSSASPCAANGAKRSEGASSVANQSGSGCYEPNQTARASEENGQEVRTPLEGAV